MNASERKRAYNRAWKKQNRDKVRVQKQRWRKKHAETIRTDKAKRRERKRLAAGRLPKAELHDRDLQMRRKRAHDAEWRKQHPDKNKANCRRYRERHRAELSVRARAKYDTRLSMAGKSRREKLDPIELADRQKAGHLAWRKRNREKVLQIAKRQGARARQSLRDHYVVDLIKSQTGLPSRLIPKDMIHAKRQYLNVLRFLKGVKQ